VGPDATERKLTAILSADVALKAYRDEIGLLARQHRGRVVDAEGDNLLAEFPSALDAMRCAADEPNPTPRSLARPSRFSRSARFEPLRTDSD
jgi:class 3 adenylate cyclase